MAKSYLASLTELRVQKLVQAKRLEKAELIKASTYRHLESVFFLFIALSLSLWKFSKGVLQIQRLEFLLSEPQTNTINCNIENLNL